MCVFVFVFVDKRICISLEKLWVGVSLGQEQLRFHRGWIGSQGWPTIGTRRRACSVWCVYLCICVFVFVCICICQGWPTVCTRTNSVRSCVFLYLYLLRVDNHVSDQILCIVSHVYRAGNVC